MKEFSISTHVFYGEGALDRLSRVKDKRVLIVCDKFMEESGVTDLIASKLTNCEVSVFSGVVPDPSVEVVSAGLKALVECGAQVVVAVGGGSSIDAAKAIRETSKHIPEAHVNVTECFAIPTTSGTGSEVTKFSVISDTKNGLKYPLVSRSLLPPVAILDPELVLTVPPTVTADTGFDVLTHALEAYVAKDASDFTDAMAEKAITLTFRFLPQAYANGGNRLAREKMHSASCLAGMAFNSAGLGINHSIAHAIGAKLHISHGRSNALLLPHVVEYNANLSGGSVGIKETSLAAKKYQRVARLLRLPAVNVHIAVGNLIQEIIKFQRAMKIPPTLKAMGADLGVFESMRSEMIDAAMADTCTAATPRQPSREDISRILDKLVL